MQKKAKGIFVTLSIGLFDIAVALGVIALILVLKRELTTQPEISAYQEIDSQVLVDNPNIREQVNAELAENLNYEQPLEYHVLEDTDFYSALLLNLERFPDQQWRVYQDISDPMVEEYQNSDIFKNLSVFLSQQNGFNWVFKSGNKDLYELLDSNEGGTPVIISDLLGIENDEEKQFLYNGDIVFCVPYESTYEPAVEHCEEIIKDILWNHHSENSIIGIQIYIVYTDEVAVSYSRDFTNKEYVQVYVP